MHGCVCVCAHTVKQGEVTPGIPASEYERRRKQLVDGLPDGSLVVCVAGHMKYMSAGEPLAHVAHVSSRSPLVSLTVSDLVSRSFPPRLTSLNCLPPPPVSPLSLKLQVPSGLGLLVPHWVRGARCSAHTRSVIDDAPFPPLHPTHPKNPRPPSKKMGKTLTTRHREDELVARLPHAPLQHGQGPIERKMGRRIDALRGRRGALRRGRRAPARELC